MNKLITFLLEVNLIYLVLLLAYGLVRNRISYSVRRFMLVLLPISAVLIFYLSRLNWSGTEPYVQGIQDLSDVKISLKGKK